MNQKTVIYLKKSARYFWPTVLKLWRTRKYTKRDYVFSTAGHHIAFCGLIDSIRLSANQQMIQLKRIENLQRE